MDARGETDMLFANRFIRSYIRLSTAMPKIIINPGTPQAREYWLRPGVNFVGREFANDLQINDATVSSSHALLTLNGDSVSVKDLGSTNGTYVNRERITETTLQPGQLLRFGGIETMLVEDVQPGQSAIPTPPPAAVAASVAVPPVQKPVPVPVPPPPVATTKLRLGGMAPPPAPPPAAVEAETAAMPAPAQTTAAQMVELPDGQSVCKFHPKNAAQWLCPKCNKPYCSVCVTVRRTGETTSYNCRTCGSTCLPVKIKYAVSKEKAVREYSDGVILMRCLGFGFGAVVLMTIVYGGLAFMMGINFLIFPAFLNWGTGAVCGLAIKIASQDRPGFLFTIMAMGATLLAVVLGTVAAALCGGGLALSFYTLFGLIGALFMAWKLSGGDF
jgi:hypothetical protein